MEWYETWWIYFVGVELLLMIVIYCLLRFLYNKKVKRVVPPLDPALTKRMRATVDKKDFRRMSIFNEADLTSDVNPFVNVTWYFTRYEAFKSAVMGVTVFPIRLVLMLLLYIFVSLWLSTCLLGCSWQLTSKQQICTFRRICLRPAIWLFMRGSLFLVGFYYIPTRGKKAGANLAPVVVCNHINGFEAMWMCYAYNCSPVAAIEQIRPFFLRPLMIALQVVPVDRKSDASRAAVLNAIKDRASAASQRHCINPPQVLLFPEGTTHNGNAIINFKIGAFAPGVPVQPVVVKFPFCHLDHSWVFTGPGMLMLLFRIMTQVVNFMHVEYLPPHVPNPAEKDDPKLFAHAVRVSMAKALGVPFTYHGVDDVLLQFTAIKQGQAPEAALIPGGVERIQQFFSITKVQVEKHFSAFVRMDKERKGKISFENFLAAFEACSGHEVFPAQKEQLTVLYDLLDANEDGQIDFGEFLVGLALIKQGRHQRKEVLRLAFDAFDREGRGHISQEDCAVLLKRMLPDQSESQALAQLFAPHANDVVSSIPTSTSVLATSDAGLDSALDVPKQNVSETASEASVRSDSKTSKDTTPAAPTTSTTSTPSTKTVTFEEFEAFVQAHPDFFSLFQANFYSGLSSPSNKS